MDVLTYALCKEYTNEAIEGISGGLTPIIVEQLPQSGESDKLYFVISQSGSGQDIYEEYIWIDNKFERLGSNAIPESTSVIELPTDSSEGSLTDEQITLLFEDNSVIKRGSDYFYKVSSDGSTATYSKGLAVSKMPVGSNNTTSINFYENIYYIYKTEKRYVYINNYLTPNATISVVKGNQANISNNVELNNIQIASTLYKNYASWNGGYTYSTTVADGDTITDTGLINAFTKHIPLTINGVYLHYLCEKNDKVQYLTATTNNTFIHLNLVEFDKTSHIVTFNQVDVNSGSTPTPSSSDFYKLMLTDAQVEVVVSVIQGVYPEEITLTLTEAQLTDIQANAMGKNIQIVASIDGVEAPIFTFNVFAGTMYICTIVNTPSQYGQYWMGTFSLDSISGGNLTIDFFPIISNINLINGIFDFGNITEGTAIPTTMQSAFSIIDAPALIKANGIVYKYLNNKVISGSTLTYYYQTFDFEQSSGVAGDALETKIMYFNNTDYAVHFIDKILNPEVRYVTFDNVTVGTNRKATLTVTENIWLQLTTFTNNPLYICKVQLNITGGNIIVLDFVKKETNTLHFGGTIGGTQYYATFVNNNGTYSGTFGEDIYVYNGRLDNNTTHAGLYNDLYNQGKPINILRVEQGIYAMLYMVNGPLKSNMTSTNTYGTIKTFTFVGIDGANGLLYKSVENVSYSTDKTSDDTAFSIEYVYNQEYEIRISIDNSVQIRAYRNLAGVDIIDALERRQRKDIVVEFTNVVLSSSNTAQLTITSDQWTYQLKDTSGRNVKVSIALSSGTTIVLDRISSETNNVRFGGNVGSTEYYATFTNNSGNYSGEFGISPLVEVGSNTNGQATSIKTQDGNFYNIVQLYNSTGFHPIVNNMGTLVDVSATELFSAIIIGNSNVLNTLATDLGINLDMFSMVITETYETRSGKVAGLIGELMRPAMLFYPLQITLVDISLSNVQANGNATYIASPAQGAFTIQGGTSQVITQDDVRADVLGIDGTPKYVLILRIPNWQTD